MWTAINRLLSLKVSDVMSRSIVEVSVSQGMGEAAAVFAARDVSSAPVIDKQGRCIGILSAADFLRRDCGGDHRNVESHVLTQEDPERASQTVPTGDRVGAYMTDAVQSIAPDQPLLNAARIMCVGHIHHLPVIDGDRLVGLISTMDVIAAMMNALDEMAVDALKKS
ncbi:MAG: CBS domain-containing protein [Planctomycetota bacterium]|nr:CBS domain-containing protein [Planctomycetota bacterium]